MIYVAHKKASKLQKKVNEPLEQSAMCLWRLRFHNQLAT